MLARGAAREHVRPVGLQPGEEGGVAEQPVFGDLGVAGAEVALGQRVEQRGVGDDQHRLVEGADQVLAVRRVDAGLAADRRVDLRQQRRRHLHEIDAAAHAGRGKAGEIADDAAAERDDQIAALDARVDDRLADAVEAGVALGALARGDADGGEVDAGGCKRGLGGLQVMLGDGLVGDDRRTRARPQRLDARPEQSEQPAADDDVVGARAERDLDGDRLAGAGLRGHLRGHGAASVNAELVRQRGDDLVDDGVVRLVARLHDDVGLRVDRLAQRQQVLDLLHQRPVVAPLGPPQQHVEIGLEPDRDALVAHQRAGALVHHGAAAGRQHLRPAAEQTRDHPRLAGAEIGLAVLVEDFRDGHAGRGLDLGIGVDERNAEAGGQAAARPRTCRRPSCRRARSSARRARATMAAFRGVFRGLLDGTIGHELIPVDEQGFLYQNRERSRWRALSPGQERGRSPAKSLANRA